jgi:murein DD-endopeptidase MepM/ murein hydrolase activator NlpD
MRSTTTVRRTALIGLLTLAAAAPAARAENGTGGVAMGAPTAPATAASPAAAPAPASPAAATPAEPAAAASPAAPAPSTAAPVTVSETQTVKLTRSQTKSVQRRAHVRADGALGSRTRAAIKRYQSKKRLVRTGRPNLQTLKAMKLSFASRIEQQLVAKQRTAAAPAPKVSSVPGYVFPIQGPWHWGGASTHFGDRGGAHEGVDMMSPCGTQLVAASAGTVKAVDVQSAAGNYVVLTGTPSGEDQAYMHLKDPSTLRVGDVVTAGQPLGLVGDTGNADGCHLHFELWTAPGWYTGGHPHDPQPALLSWGANPTS